MRPLGYRESIVRSLVFAGCAGLWLLTSACAFDSSGTVGGGPGSASVGSAGTSETSADNANDTTSNMAESGPPGADSTTSTGSAPGSSGPFGESTGLATTGVATDPLDGGEPPTTTSDSTAAVTTDDGGVMPDPYYGDCTEDADCSPGTCLGVDVIDGPSAAVCMLPCDAGGCPAPDDVLAMPVCTMSNDCMLSCVGQNDCPIGMACYSFNADAYRRCLWPQGA